MLWNGEVRVRGEIDGRDFNNKTPPNAFGLLRARIGADVMPVEKAHLVFQLQGARVFGRQSLPGDVLSANLASSAFDLYQGYLKLSDFFIDGVTATAGRMEVSFGNERIMGASDWNNTGRSLDGVRLTYQWAGQSVDVFFMNILETQLPPDVVTPFSVTARPEEGQSVSGFYASLRPVQGLRMDAYLLREWVQHQTDPGSDDLSRFTGGTYLKGPSGAMDYEGEFAYQFGTRIGNDISAFMLTGAAGYSFSGFPLSSVTIGYEYLSGTSLSDRQYRTFEHVYQTSHKFYGFMEYFQVPPENTYGRGLQDALLRVTFKPEERVSATLWAHAFWLAQPVIGLWSLGQEIDIVGTYDYNDHVTLEFGASGFLPGDLMRIRFNGNDVAWWGYCSTRIWF